MRNQFKRHTSNPQAGFSLIEVVVVLTIMSMIAGAAMPTIQTARNIQARRATLTELSELGDGALEYARDTGVVPTSADDLLADPGISGWAGPYLGLSVDDQWTGLGGWGMDGWSNPYIFTVVGNLLTLTSYGSDQAADGGDDVVLSVDPTPVWREETRRHLEVLNLAVVLYNGTYMSTDPLPTTWSQALNKLVSRGYLPVGVAEYSTDAWGDSYEPNPAGAMPVVQVSSPNL